MSLDIRERQMKGGVNATSATNLNVFTGTHGRTRSSGVELIDWTPYVARHVRTLYQRRDGAALGEAKMFVRPFAVVAMADISGYTKLTTTLASRGDGGAESLTKILNPYLQFMVDIVEKSGGDIIKFIGDAILISWELKGTKEETVASACWGCLRLIERLGDHHVEITDQEKFLLSMHIGLAVGETFDVHVGNESRMEYFLAGKAVKEAVQLVNVASTKEIAITGETLRNLDLFKEQTGMQLDVAGKTGGIILKSMEFPRDATGGVTYNFSARNAPEPPAPKKIYQRYINESVVYRILSSPGQEFDSATVNELRKVSVLFVKIEGINAHSTESLPLLQSTMEVVLGVLKNYDGTLRQMVIDDKGATLLAVFGLPPYSHENNSIFGVRAALQLQSLLKHLVSFSIGLTTGTLFTGVIGSRKRCDHTILGEPVNLAARMMCSSLSANGGILCDSNTMKATKDEIEFTQQEPQNFFKNSGPIDCFTVLRQKNTFSKGPAPATAPSGDHQLPITSLIGREEELRTIEELFTKFTELFKLERSQTMGPGDAKPQVRRKGSVPLLYRSVSFNSGNPPSTFHQNEIPRVIIEGDGGFGKSSLLGFIRDLGVQHSYAICPAKADEVDKSTPYFVFRDIVCELFDLIISHFERSAPAETQRDESQVPDKEPEHQRNHSSPNLLKNNETYFAKKVLGTLTKSKSMQSTSSGTLKIKNNRNVLAQLQDEAARSDFVDKAMLAMSLLGLDPNHALLLSPILPILGSLDKLQERKEVATDVVCRLFERFAVVISPIVITIDDSHWMDTYSFKLTWALLRRCTGVFLALGSRGQHISEPVGLPPSMSAMSIPSMDEDGNALQMAAMRSSVILGEPILSATSLYNKIKALPSTKTLELKGVSREAVEKIVTLHCGFPVRSVQEKLLNEIVKRTGSNPLFVERLAANMKGKSYFGVSPSGELILKGAQSVASVSSPLDALDWGDDPESAMLVQFDRLPSDLLLIMRAASVIGQSFSLDLVSHILENKIKPKDCFNTIIGFTEAHAFIGWEEPDPRDKLPTFKMFFKSAVLQKCIYQGMLSDQRQDFHHKIAKRYELSLNNGNRPQLLPLIAYHYGQSKDIFKKIQSLDDVSSHFVETGAFTEAITSLTKLLDLYEQEDRRTEKNPRDRRKNLSRWNMLLGTAYVGRSEWSKGQRHLFEALSFLDFEFPSTRFQVRIKDWRNSWEQKKQWRNRHEAVPLISDMQEIDRVEQVCAVLNALNTSFTFIGDGKSAQLCLLIQLNFCESLGLETAKLRKLHFGQIEAAYAMLLWMKNKRSLSLEYFGRAKSICEYSESNEDLQNYYTLRSTMLLSSGRIKESLECLQTVIDLHRRHTGGVAGTHVIHIDMALISLLDGEFEQHREDIVSVYETAVDNSDDGSLTEAACMMIQSLLLAPPHFPEGTSDVTNWVSVAEGMFDSWTDARSSNIHLLNLSSTLFLFYAFKSSIKAKTYCDQFVSCLERSKSRLRSPLGYLIVIYIFFFLLAQHRMYLNRYENREKVEWKIPEAVRTISAAMKALNLLKKWWSFAVPIFYLAEGLVSLFKGSSRSAVSSWRSGIKRTDQISDNLKFLKAALQVRAVRYAKGGNDALRMEAAEFLQKVGARTELSLVIGEIFSPLPIIEEEEESETSDIAVQILHPE